MGVLLRIVVHTGAFEASFSHHIVHTRRTAVCLTPRPLARLMSTSLLAPPLRLNVFPSSFSTFLCRTETDFRTGEKPWWS